jgi:hypothetical protein
VTSLHVHTTTIVSVTLASLRDNHTRCKELTRVRLLAQAVHTKIINMPSGPAYWCWQQRQVTVWSCYDDDDAAALGLPGVWLHNLLFPLLQPTGSTSQAEPPCQDPAIRYCCCQHHQVVQAADAMPPAEQHRTNTRRLECCTMVRQMSDCQAHHAAVRITALTCGHLVLIERITPKDRPAEPMFGSTNRHAISSACDHHLALPATHMPNCLYSRLMSASSPALLDGLFSIA